MIDSATKIPNLTLRFAQESDIETILQFIRDLAEYERLSHEVRADLDGLRRYLFGEQPMAEVIIAEYQEIPVGFALFFHNFSTFAGRPGLYLEDIYVQPAFRGRGIGQSILIFLAQLAKERGCARFEWAVLDWNEPAINFYRKLGAKPLDEWTIFRVAGQALDKLAHL